MATDDSHLTPLHFAVAYHTDKILQLILKYVKKENSFMALNVPRGLDGYTALHVAISQELTTKAQILLEHGADIMVCDKDGVSALDLALSSRFLSIQELGRAHQNRMQRPSQITNRTSSQTSVIQLPDPANLSSTPTSL